MGLTIEPGAGMVGVAKSRTEIGGRVAHEPCASSGTMSGMTPASPTAALSAEDIRTLLALAVDGAAPADSVSPFVTSDQLTAAVLLDANGVARPWFLATCHRCGLDNDHDNGVPFRDDSERDFWAVSHVAATDHVVQVSTELDGQPYGGHSSAMLRYTEAEGWFFLCTDSGCERWNGRYDSGQLALASYRGHVRKAAQR